MSEERPYCISIAGFDPSAGAGVLSDIKVFEAHNVYGFGVVSALTYQNDNDFIGVNWCSNEEIEKQIVPLAKYPVKVAKIGLIEGQKSLTQVCKLLKNLFPQIFIVWDPILQSSSGFNFHKSIDSLEMILESIDLITPNYQEYKQLKLEEISKKCSVLLKGGHRETKRGTDFLYVQEKSFEIEGVTFDRGIGKHGTGCVLSSAIASNIAKGFKLLDSCTNAKGYVEKFILSNKLNLGYHD